MQLTAGVPSCKTGRLPGAAAECPYAEDQPAAPEWPVRSRAEGSLYGYADEPREGEENLFRLGCGVLASEQRRISPLARLAFVI